MQLIELADRPDPASHLASIRERKHLTGATLDAETILGHRDADRR